MARGSRIGLVTLVATSAPLALVFESFVRNMVSPPGFERLGDGLEALATDAAWVLVGLCALAGFLAVLLQRRWCTRRIEGVLRPRGDIERVIMDRTLLSMSIPQIPAILATVAFMGGSAVGPVIAAMAVSSLGVVAQGVQWEAILASTRRSLDA